MEEVDLHPYAQSQKLTNIRLNSLLLASLDLDSLFPGVSLFLGETDTVVAISPAFVEVVTAATESCWET